MKQPLKLYLTSETIEKLKQKAAAAGFDGRGAIALYVEKIAKEPVVFMDNNVSVMIKLLKS